MSRLRLLLSLLVSAGLAIGTSVTRSQGGDDRDWRLDFRRGMESFDYERFREAALLFGLVADDGPPEGSRPDLQVYGQRWVPYLPHYLLGAALFEAGHYEGALAEWAASSSELAALGEARRRSGLERYKRRTSRRGDYSHRLVDEIVPAAMREAEGALDEARKAWAEASRELLLLALPEQRGFETSLERVGAELEALEAELDGLVKARLSPAGADVSRTPSAFLPLVRSRQRATRVAERAASLRSQVEALLQAADRWLLEQLESGADGRGPRGPSEPPLFRPAATRGAAEPVLASCGYPADPEGRLERALSDFVAADAITRVRGCTEIRAIALPRLRCALGVEAELARMPPAVRALHAVTLSRFDPRLALTRAAARCGEREAAVELLAASPGDGSSADRASIQSWLAATERPGFSGSSQALLIGAWDYAHWPDLPGVREDLESVRRELLAQGFAVSVLENPTEGDLRAEMTRLPGRLSREDRLLVYYAGHGHVTEDPARGLSMGWIVPVDAPRAGSRGVPSGAVSMDQMRSWALRDLGFLRAQLFVLDSCFSGRIFLPGDVTTAVCGGSSPSGERLRRSFPFLVPDGSPARTVARMEGRTARVLLSAGSSGERVPDASRFREELVSAIAGRETEADPDRDGYLLVDGELGPYLGRRLGGTGGPVPQHSSLCPGGDFVFRLPWVDALPAGGVGGACDGDPLAVLRDVYQWEALRDAGAVEAYLSASECRLFADLAREILAGGPASAPGRDG